MSDERIFVLISGHYPADLSLDGAHGGANDAAEAAAIDASALADNEVSEFEVLEWCEDFTTTISGVDRLAALEAVAEAARTAAALGEVQEARCYTPILESEQDEEEAFWDALGEVRAALDALDSARRLTSEDPQT